MMSCCLPVALVVAVVVPLSRGAVERSEDRHPQCICNPTMRIELTDLTGGSGGGRGMTVCNNATVNWLLNVALERISRQSEQIDEMMASTKKMEEELGEGRDLWTIREKEVDEMRTEIQKLVYALEEKDERIAILERELDSAEEEIKRLKANGSGEVEEEENRSSGKDEDDEERSTHKESKVRLFPRDCSDIQESGLKYSGIYTVYPLASSSSASPTAAAAADGLQVFCDLNTDGGHWTVVQRRQDGSETFERRWSEYRNGFGVLTKEFWLGNENIHRISSQRSNELRVDVTDFDSLDYFAVYDSFWIGNESDRYSLHLGRYSGNAGDSLSSHNGWPFSTIESDNDGSRSGNCSELYGGGGWWFARCYDANLNGRYADTEAAKTIVWFRLPKDKLTSLRSTEMKIRPRKEEKEVVSK